MLFRSRIQCAFNGGDRAEVPLAPLEEARRYREAETKWKAEFDPAKQRLDDLLKQIRKALEPAVRHAKIDALKISDEEKALLKNDPEAKETKELSKKFSKELKVEDKDYRQFVSEAERVEWDSHEQALEAVEIGRAHV